MAMATAYTLVIPTYNEAPIIRQTLKEVSAVFSATCKVPWHMIVADNASTDHTSDIVEALHDPHVSVIRLKEKGRGRAIRAAFQAAPHGIVGFTDADLPIEPREVLTGFDMIARGESEIVVGTRFGRGSDVAGRTLLRSGSTVIFHILARIIVGLHASDSQCPLKIMNDRARPIMLATTDPTWWSELEFLLLAEKLHMPLKELPITWNDARYPQRKSTIKFVKDSLRAILAMFEMRLSLHRQLTELRRTLR
jgi:glycosyltransferase involved in cell wall biosynthesis